MNILYLSCHEVLEYYELSLLYELGHEIISIGGYNDPRNPKLSPRPSIDQDQQELAQIVSHIPICSDLNHIDERLIKWADVVWIMHRPEWLSTIMQQVGSTKTVVLRTIGQNIAYQESIINKWKRLYTNLHIVRYSPLEVLIPGFTHMDALIRFYVDPDIYEGWTGIKDNGLVIAQNINSRNAHCNTEFLLQAASAVGADVYGRMNGAEIPELEYPSFLSSLRDHRFIIITGTIPASYTLTFIEALMTGIPVMAIGPELGGKARMFGPSAYEVPYIITDNVNGFIVNTVQDVVSRADILASDIAHKISNQGRKTALNLFSKCKIKYEWDNFLCSL